MRLPVDVVLADATNHPDLFSTLLAVIEHHDKEQERLAKEAKRRR